MATVTWTGNAHSVKQISTVTFAGTWAGTDTVTATINGKDLIVTCGTATTTTALAATALKEAWEAATRLDGTGTTDSTSNFGGQEFGEFAEITASVSGSVVTLIGNKAGNDEKETDKAGRPKYTFDGQRFYAIFQSWALSRIVSTSDRQFKNFADDPDWSKIMLNTLTGMQDKTFNLDEEQAKRIEERKRQMEQTLIRWGERKEKGIIYKPKPR